MCTDSIKTLITGRTLVKITPDKKHLPKDMVSLDIVDKTHTDELILKTVRKVLNAGASLLLPGRKVSVELLVVGQEEIHALNKSQRGIDRPTDVLSFPSVPFQHGCIQKDNLSPGDLIDGRLFLGSIVICSDFAFSQAAEYGHSAEREFAFLAAHSLLHLLGWDHEKSQDEEKAQFELQEKILTSCRILR